MRLPPGYGRKGKVTYVKKGIYELRQSGNLWHKTLSIAFGKLSHGVFYTHDNEGATIVCSSTDDFTITASSVPRMAGFKSALSDQSFRDVRSGRDRMDARYSSRARPNLEDD